jgi:hypothetical protein
MPLITAAEVVHYSPVNRDYDKTKLCNLILQVEEDWFYQCLGADMYAYLLGDLSETPNPLPVWKSVENYALGDVVKNNDCVFISTAAHNCTQPGEVDSDWGLYPKFQGDCSNELWTRYLAQILSLKVYSMSLIFNTWRASSGGLTVNETNNAGIRAGNSKEMSMTKDEILGLIEITVQNMVRWLAKKVKETDCGFPTNIPALNCGTDCETPKSSERRWGLSNSPNYLPWGY